MGPTYLCLWVHLCLYVQFWPLFYVYTSHFGILVKITKKTAIFLTTHIYWSHLPIIMGPSSTYNCQSHIMNSCLKGNKTGLAAAGVHGGHCSPPMSSENILKRDILPFPLQKNVFLLSFSPKLGLAPSPPQLLNRLLPPPHPDC